MKDVFGTSVIRNLVIRCHVPKSPLIFQIKKYSAYRFGNIALHGGYAPRELQGYSNSFTIHLFVFIRMVLVAMYFV